MNELISVIIPVYNCQNYIKEAITSVINQTYENWELIIVNDFSSDNTAQIVEGYMSLEKQIKLINLEQHQGAYYARNTGVANSRGRYVAFLDADDIWNKKKLEKQYQYMKNNNITFCYTGFEYVNQDNTKCLHITQIPKQLQYQQALKNTIINCSSVMIDTQYINKNLLTMPKREIGEDVLTWWHILKNDFVAYGLQENLVKYRRGKHTLTANKCRMAKERWKMYRKEEKMSILKSLYYFSFYMFYSIKRRII